jgi:hypothetical protein
MKRILARSEHEPEGLVDKDSHDSEGGVEDAECGDHRDRPTLRTAYGEQRQDDQAPDHVQRVVTCIAWQDAQHVQQQKRAALE